MLLITPAVLFILGVSVLIFSGSVKSKQFILWLVFAYLFTLTVEIIGVNTGKIFGKYVYGNILGYKFIDVPLIIGFNWMFVILGAVSVSSQFSKNILIVSIISALISVMFDFILEPVAMKLGYWEWNSDVVPVQNYLSWFLISFILSFSFIYFNIKINSKVFIHYFTGLIIFFLILNLK